MMSNRPYRDTAPLTTSEAPRSLLLLVTMERRAMLLFDTLSLSLFLSNSFVERKGKGNTPYYYLLQQPLAL